MSLPAWFDKTLQRQNDISRKQESDRAKEIGGKAQSGSGSSWRAPQDVKSEDALEQLKFTNKNSFSIKAEEWEQIRSDALQSGREPRMLIEFKKQNIRLLIVEI